MTSEYDRVVGIDFDALAAKTGFPADQLRAFDREVSKDGIQTLMAEVERWKQYAAFLEGSLCTTEHGDIDPRHITAMREEAVSSGILQLGDLPAERAMSVPLGISEFRRAVESES